MWARAVDGLLTSVLDGVRTWLESHEGPLAYLVLALAAMLEYVVPPLPGDTIALFGVSLASTAGWNPWAIYAALNAGAIAGGQLAYSAGRYFGPRARRPAFLRGKRVEAELERVIVLFRERGAIALALNRFVPAGMPWLHVDLASESHKGGLGLSARDITGYGVRLTRDILANYKGRAKKPATKTKKK